MFSAVGRRGGSMAFLLAWLLPLIGLLVVFKSAAIAGQENPAQPPGENPDVEPPQVENGGEPGVDTTGPNPATPSNGGGNGGGGDGGRGGGGKKVDGRHILFEKYMKGEEGKGKAMQAFNYICQKFGDEGPSPNGNRPFCGCVPKGGGDKWKPDNFHYPIVDLKCLDAFYRVAMMSMCGNEWFDQMKLCALTHFFEDSADVTKLTDEDEAHKKTLLLIDGCALCNTGGEITEIQVSHMEEEAGGVFSNCGDKVEQTDFMMSSGEKEFKINVPSGKEVNVATASFSIPVVLYHRICGQIFGNAEVSEQYKNLKLTIKHNCGGPDKTLTVNLPDVDRKTDPFVTNKVGELRGLKLDLDSGTWEQFKREEGPTTLPKYTARDPLEWQDAKVGECWHGKDNDINKCKL